MPKPRLPRVPLDADPETWPPKTCKECKRDRKIDQFHRTKSGLLDGSCKECRNAKAKANYEANKEAYQARHKKWREENPEQDAAYRRKYAEEHKEEFKGYSRKYRESEKYAEWYKAYREANAETLLRQGREYRLNFPGKAAESQAKYYAANAETIKDRRARWAVENPGRYRARVVRFAHKRRTREADVPNDLTADQWAEIVASQGNKCAYCNTAFGLFLRPTRDHIIPVSKGGGLTASNILACCQPCNSSKGTKIVARPKPRARPRRSKMVD